MALLEIKPSKSIFGLMESVQKLAETDIEKAFGILEAAKGDPHHANEFKYYMVKLALEEQEKLSRIKGDVEAWDFMVRLVFKSGINLEKISDEHEADFRGIRGMLSHIMWGCGKEALIDLYIGTKLAQYKKNDSLAQGLKDLLNSWYNDFTEKPDPDFDIKFILPVYDILSLSSNNFIKLENILPIDISIIRNSPKFQFPMGHPLPNTLYVRHPYNPNVYIPYENHEFEFLKDKVRELTEIAQYLGATEIDVRVVSDGGNSQKYGRSTNVGGGIGNRYFGVSVDSKRNVHQYEEENWAQIFNRHQKFYPAKPQEPQNTLWYQGETSWQGLVRQRMRGTIREHHETLETRSSRVVSGSSVQSISSELKTFYADLGLHWGEDEEYTFSEKSNLVLSVSIKFD